MLSYQCARVAELADAQDLGCGKSPVFMRFFNDLR